MKSRRLSRRRARPHPGASHRPSRRDRDDIDFEALAKLRRVLASPQWAAKLAELAEAESFPGETFPVIPTPSEG